MSRLILFPGCCEYPSHKHGCVSAWYVDLASFRCIPKGDLAVSHGGYGFGL